MSTSPGSALPRPFTSFVGREDDITAIDQLLRSRSGSVLTLTGPAGVGKTRLAVAVAQRAADRFADGVIFVDLSPITNRNAVLPVLVRAVGLPDGESAGSRLAGYLSDRSLLLVIDNFEQVREAAAELNACLKGAADVRALLTSQAPLRVSGERVYPVQPLAVPGRLGNRPMTPETLTHIANTPAVDLFVRRARTIRPTFELTERNAAVIVEVCRQLDGLPLAIELAAARSGVLSPEALLTRLASPLGLLNAGPRDAPDRHRTLQSAIAWSFDLLPDDEALLFERLSIFSGSFSLEAAEAVAGDAPIRFLPSFYVDSYEVDPVEPRIDEDRVIDLLDTLVDLGLVQRIERDAEEARFRLFGAIRQFAAAALAKRGSTRSTALRHATWFRAKAEATWNPSGTPELEWRWLGPLALDDDNLHAALAFLGDTDPASAAVFASSLCWYFYFNGQRLDGLREMERMDGRFDPEPLPAVVRARIDYAFGVLLVQLPNRQAAGVKRFESMLATVESIGLEWAAGFAMLAMGIVAEDTGDYARSIELCQGARVRLAPFPDTSILPNVDVHIATSSFGLGDVQAAKELALPIANAPHERVGPNVVYALILLGVIGIVERDFQEAARFVREYLDLCLAYRLTGVVTESIEATAALLAEHGDHRAGAVLFGAADRLNAETGNPSTFPERPVYETARERARNTLGAERFRELHREGGLLSLEPALKLTRDYLTPIELGTATSHSSNQRPQLTRREREVLQLVASGLTDREIGDRLFISHRTARTHVANILEKLNAPSRSAATTLALREGVIRLDDMT